MTLYTMAIRDVTSVTVALATEHLPPAGGEFPAIGSGARNLGEGGGVDDVWVGGVDAVGVGVAIDGDCGGAGNVGNISIVERSGALDGRGECTTFSVMVVLAANGAEMGREGDRRKVQFTILILTPQ
jgi:hypothetical protein